MSTNAQAQKRASVIMEVRSGKMSVEEGARKLGVSRKTYYELENRALLAMVGAVGKQRPGRPKVTRDPEKVRLKGKVRVLEKELSLARMKLRIQDVMKEVMGSEPLKAIKKNLQTKAGEDAGDHETGTRP